MSRCHLHDQEMVITLLEGEEGPNGTYGFRCPSCRDGVYQLERRVIALEQQVASLLAWISVPSSSG